MTKVDPDTLPDTTRMNQSEAIVAKCHASNQVHLIEEEIKRLQKLKKKWSRRYSKCMRRLHNIAIDEAFANNPGALNAASTTARQGSD